MSETKILYANVDRGQPRVPVVSRQEWAAIFSEYPDHLRYHAANLAAHNWDVVMIEGRILIASGWGGGHWIDKDGSRTELTSDEIDSFYPRSSDPDDRYRADFAYDDSIKSPRKRHITLPCTACGGTGRMGPFFPGGVSTVCGNCADPSPQAREVGRHDL